MKRTDTGPFSMVPEWVLDAEVSDRAVRLYAAMRRYADKEGTCWPSRRTIAERLHCSTDSVDRAMAELVTLGAIEVVPRKDDEGQHSNYYTVLAVRHPLGKVAEGGLGKVAAQNESHLERETRTTYECAQMAREITNEWWTSQNPRPAQPYIAVVKVVENALRAGWSQPLLLEAMDNVPTISARWLEGYVNRHKKGAQPDRLAAVKRMLENET